MKYQLVLGSSVCLRSAFQYWLITNTRLFVTLWKARHLPQNVMRCTRKHARKRTHTQAQYRARAHTHTHTHPHTNYWLEPARPQTSSSWKHSGTSEHATPAQKQIHTKPQRRCTSERKHLFRSILLSALAVFCKIPGRDREQILYTALETLASHSFNRWCPAPLPGTLPSGNGPSFNLRGDTVIKYL